MQRKCVSACARGPCASPDALHSREARDAAEWDAWYVFGVDNVINELEVIP